MKIRWSTLLGTKMYVHILIIIHLFLKFDSINLIFTWSEIFYLISNRNKNTFWRHFALSSLQ